MELHTLKNTPGARKKRKRIGRGDGSGTGHTAGRGEKGAGSRSGSGFRPFHEGGQITFFRRLPKRGFKNPNHKEYTVVNLAQLEAAYEANAIVDQESVLAKGLVNQVKCGLKVLANGDITKPMTVKANRFSATAKAKIEAAGGKCEEV